MPRKSAKPELDTAIQSFTEKVEELQKDPLKGRFQLDVPTLNFIGEIALGQRDEGDFTPAQLAALFHQHLEGVFSNRVCDERSSRENLIGILELSLRLNVVDRPSQRVPGYTCIGTLFLRRTVTDHVVTLSFRRHPLLHEIYFY